MSIQPNRVLNRIVEQVDQSDWPELEAVLLTRPETGESLRFFSISGTERDVYATPLHFWVHALRDHLAQIGRRRDLVDAACQALCRDQALTEWQAELARFAAGGQSQVPGPLARAQQIAPGSRGYRMLDDACRRSSVFTSEGAHSARAVGAARDPEEETKAVANDGWWMAHFWNHGGFPIWRRRLVASLLATLVLSFAGCSDPDRVILDGMGEADAARFRRGRALSTPCWTCHDLAGPANKIGPSLLGIHGRRSGTAPGHVSSAALRAASVVWDDASLRAFLSDPGGFIPGNEMVSPGIANSAALADLLFYLRAVTRPGAREMPAR